MADGLSEQLQKEWREQVRQFVDDLIADHSTAIGEGEKAKKVGGYKNLSPANQLLVDAVERSIQKTGFDTGIRVIYLAKKENDGKRITRNS